MKTILEWSTARTEERTRHFLHLPGGYYILSRNAGRTGYSRKGKAAGADWEVRYTDRFGQNSVRCGLITGLARAKAFAERLANDTLIQ